MSTLITPQTHPPKRGGFREGRLSPTISVGPTGTVRIWKGAAERMGITAGDGVDFDQPADGRFYVGPSKTGWRTKITGKNGLYTHVSALQGRVTPGTYELSASPFNGFYLLTQLPPRPSN